MRSFRSFRGVPAASPSGARSRCGLGVENAMACTLGDKSGGIATQNPHGMLVSFTMPDLMVNRNGAICYATKPWWATLG